MRPLYPEIFLTSLALILLERHFPCVAPATCCLVRETLACTGSATSFQAAWADAPQGRNPRGGMPQNPW